MPVPPDAAPGDYEATVTVGARGVTSKAVRLGLRVAGTPLPAGGDDEPERLSRLRWLDSRLAQDDGLVPPYTPVVAKGRTLSILGRTVELDASGFPRSIRSRFTPEVTSAAGPPREILAAAVALVVEGEDGARLTWTHDGPKVTKQAEGAAEWQATSRAGSLTAAVHGRIEFDGTIEYEVALRGGRRGGPRRRAPRAAAARGRRALRDGPRLEGRRRGRTGSTGPGTSRRRTRTRSGWAT